MMNSFTAATKTPAMFGD